MIGMFLAIGLVIVTLAVSYGIFSLMDDLESLQHKVRYLGITVENLEKRLKEIEECKENS
jgi:hypothetical protein